jgi:hypothetical protein
MAIQQNLVLEQGANFQAVIKLYADNISALNLTGYSGISQMRRSYDSVSASAVLAVAIPTPITGEIYLTLDATSSVGLRYGRYLYDILITDTSTGTKTRAVEGIITVTPRVTR